MSLTTEQLSARRAHVGSSEIAAIFGEDPFKSAWDVWAEKTGKVEPFAGNEATRRGNYLEPCLMLFAEDALGHPIERSLTFVDLLGSPLAANLDGLCRPLNANVEAKSVSGAITPDEWGEEWTDQVPTRVILQTHAAMACAGLSISYVPVILPIFRRFELKMFEVPFVPALADAIRERAAWFWQHVERDVPPSNSVPSIEVLRRLRREPEKIVEIPDDVADRFVALRAARLQAAKDEEAAQAALLAQLGDAEGGRFSGGMVTYLTVSKKAETKPRPAMSYRQLRVKETK